MSAATPANAARLIAAAMEWDEAPDDFELCVELSDACKAIRDELCLCGHRRVDHSGPCTSESETFGRCCCVCFVGLL